MTATLFDKSEFVPESAAAEQEGGATSAAGGPRSDRDALGSRG